MYKYITVSAKVEQISRHMLADMFLKIEEILPISL